MLQLLLVSGDLVPQHSSLTQDSHLRPIRTAGADLRCRTLPRIGNFFFT